jgi:NAD(P)-dependent dehydrogenase (short-subunit alcohol dehydrogenase family)
MRGRAKAPLRALSKDDMMTHQGKVALVTGGKQGIGRGIADLLAARGASVVIVNREAADDEAAEIGNGAISVVGDVSQEADWALIATQVERAFGRLDILVHAAGIYPTAPLDKMTFGDGGMFSESIWTRTFWAPRPWFRLCAGAAAAPSLPLARTQSVSCCRTAWRTTSRPKWASLA